MGFFSIKEKQDLFNNFMMFNILYMKNLAHKELTNKIAVLQKVLCEIQY